jgi:hypothetical protein
MQVTAKLILFPSLTGTFLYIYRLLSTTYSSDETGWGGREGGQKFGYYVCGSSHVYWPALRKLLSLLCEI